MIQHSKIGIYSIVYVSIYLVYFINNYPLLNFYVYTTWHVYELWWKFIYIQNLDNYFRCAIQSFGFINVIVCNNDQLVWLSTFKIQQLDKCQRTYKKKLKDK